MRAIRLKTEYLKNPIGIDTERPRVSWNCTEGVKQEAYEIEARNENGQVIWNSGQVQSDRMHLNSLDGLHLKSRDIVFWKVRLMENEVWGEWSESASFEMGLLEQNDWKAKWISGDYKPNKKERYPVDYFRKTFIIPADKQVAKARIYASACGIYEITLNGKKAGDFCLAPGYTDYNKRIQYQTIDVTEQLKALNEVELTAMLASGWYRGSIGAHGLRCQYGKETKLLVQLEVFYNDGERQVICSDESWDWCRDGQVLYADNKDGEYVDANNTPSFSAKAKVTSHRVCPTASNNVDLIEHEHFKGQISKTPSGRYIADFGQNIAGCISIKFMAHKGQILRFRFGELLSEDGELVQTNIQCISKKRITPLQEIIYVCKEGLNEYKNSFSIFGFQYLEITSKNIEIDDRDYFRNYYQEAKQKYSNVNEEPNILNFNIESIALYSNIEETGFFDSSNKLLNQFVYATKWSTKGNSADIPTDCPTRERHGWAGDAQIFFKSASFLFDYAAFSKKYINDVYDWQKKNGKLPMIAPYGGVDFYMQTMNGSVGWSDVGVIIPYYFYKMNGDAKILEEYYPRMKKYAEFMQRRCGKWGGVYAKPTHVKGPYKKYIVNCGQSYDEWAEPQDVNMFHWTDFAAPHPEVSTAYTSYIMHLMAEIARTIGRNEDAKNYEKYETGCKMAYQELVKQPGFRLDTDRQARLVRPLVFNLLSDEDRDFAEKRLLKALENYGYRLGTGFLSTPLIMGLLSEIDLNSAYKLLENEEIPGWLSMPKAGATTIWEAWEGSKAKGEVASLNHYSKGALCEWLFSGMCGINIEGENHFVIKPLPGGHFEFANATYNSVFGKVKCGWRRNGDDYSYEVEIPANTTASLLLPGKEEELLTAGKYNF